MVSILRRRHFVPNPVVMHSTGFRAKRRGPLSIHTWYDADGELTAATYSNFAHAPTSNTSLSYDSNGNRTNAPSPPNTIGGSNTGVGNRLLFDGTYYYTYDADGNCLMRTAVSGGAITAYTWNNANQLTSVSQYAGTDAYNAKSATCTVDYFYDAFGRMVRRVAGETTENYVYDGENLALVMGSGGLEREFYVPGTTLVLATEDAMLWTGTQPYSAVTWLFTDNQGSVRDEAVYVYNETTGLGTVAVGAHEVYDAFGQVTWQGPQLPGSRNQAGFGYDSMLQDSVSGLDCAMMRWYNPATGNWLSQDPIGFDAGQTNLSEFCGNSPTNWIDPSGMDAFEGYYAMGYPGFGGQAVSASDRWITASLRRSQWYSAADRADAGLAAQEDAAIQRFAGSRDPKAVDDLLRTIKMRSALRSTASDVDNAWTRELRSVAFELGPYPAVGFISGGSSGGSSGTGTPLRLAPAQLAQIYHTRGCADCHVPGQLFAFSTLQNIDNLPAGQQVVVGTWMGGKSNAEIRADGYAAAYTTGAIYAAGITAAVCASWWAVGEAGGGGYIAGLATMEAQEAGNGTCEDGACIDRIEQHGVGPGFQKHAHGWTGPKYGRGQPWSINQDGTAHDNNFTRIPKPDAETLREKGFDVPTDRYPRSP